MFASTSIYWAFVVYDTFTIASVALSGVNGLLPAEEAVRNCINQGGPCNASEITPSGVSDVSSKLFGLANHDIPREYCVGTAALTVNITIGDAIVFGRVWVLWPRSLLIRLVFVVLLLETVGYRAWEHRALARSNGLRSFLGRAQVSRALTLLIESGSFYSVIWTVVVVYQFIFSPPYKDNNGVVTETLHSSAYRAFTAGWEAFMEGGLVIVIAIYPTVIMLLVALNRSECDTMAIASECSSNGQDVATLPVSVILRDSTHHAQFLEVLGPEGCSIPASPVSNSASSSSLSNLEVTVVDCFERAEVPVL
ncbi:hypothetical protein GSI_03504 [Ganoderma sinense ZZ0214-1]|uniref:Uncharacterized protein n=1 Tax=Ganoderma sinense ZZ0214-1 TaxID=1077348 RepID=A0A2G8SLX4_9APHY|nr:hypothetical protein GSI_03504 [Ganoderma sinense ZZ0214-1]